MFKEIQKVPANKSQINQWAAFMYDQFRGNKDKMLNKLDYICRDRFSDYGLKCQNYILEIIEKMGDTYYGTN